MGPSTRSSHLSLPDSPNSTCHWLVIGPDPKGDVLSATVPPGQTVADCGSGVVTAMHVSNATSARPVYGDTLLFRVARTMNWTELTFSTTSNAYRCAIAMSGWPVRSV